MHTGIEISMGQQIRMDDLRVYFPYAVDLFSDEFPASVTIADITKLFGQECILRSSSGGTYVVQLGSWCIAYGFLNLRDEEDYVALCLCR